MGKLGLTKYFTITPPSFLPYSYCPTSCLLEKTQCIAEYCDMIQFGAYDGDRCFFDANGNSELGIPFLKLELGS